MLHQLLPRLGGAALALALVCAASPALSASWLTCPEKVLDTATISGIYQGWYEAEEGLHSIGIKVPGEDEPVYISASQEDAERYFGTQPGQAVSVTYQLEQFWIPEGRECFRALMLKEGHRLRRITPSRQNLVGKYNFTLCDGSLKLSPTDKEGRLEVDISTTTSDAYICSFGGLCTVEGNMLSCRDTSQDEIETPVEIRIHPYGLEVLNGYEFSCGARGLMLGFYMPE